jgi:hypothetical protein
MRRNIIIALWLAGITLAVYWPAGRFDLVYFDDPLFVTESPEINSGITAHSLLWASTSVIAANWHPVTNLSFLLTHQFWGASPGAEHWVNAALHAANATLLFLLLARLTGARGRSALVAAVFAWHPLRVESVAWIAERKDVLSGFFFFLTLLAYSHTFRPGCRALGEKNVRHTADRLWTLDFEPWTPRPKASFCFWAGVGFYALGLMSKAMLVTVPFVLLLLDVWPLRRFGVQVRDPQPGPGAGAVPRPDGWSALPWRRLVGLVWEKWPYFALTLVFCGVTYWVQQTHAAVSPLERTGWDVRLGNVILSYVRYLGKTLWPADLAALYPFPINEHSYLALWPAWGIGLAAAGLLGVTGWCVWQLPRRPYLAVGWLWYVGMLLPVIGLVQVGGQGMADRYTYLPMIGPVLAAVWGLADCWLRKTDAQLWTLNLGLSRRSPARRDEGGTSDFGPWTFLQCGPLSRLRTLDLGPWTLPFPAALAWVIPAACLWATHEQLEYWRDTVSLFGHTVAVTGDNYMAQLTLGYGYEHAGRVAEALAQYRTAGALYPTDKQAPEALGRLAEKNRSWAAAAAAYETVLRLDPHEAAAHLGLADVLPHLGRNAEAVGHLEAALQDDSSSPELLNNLAWALATSADPRLRNGPRAVQLAEQACARTYDQQTIMIGTLAAAYAEAGRFEQAVAAAQKACASASARGETNLLQANQNLLKLYQEHQAWHEAGDGGG